MLKEGFIICENDIKNQILRDIKGFVDYTFIDSKSLLKGLTFDISKEGILAYSIKSKIKPEILKEYFKYIPYISLFDKVGPNHKIEKLKEIYNYLLDNDFLIFDNSYKSYLKKKHISFVGYDSLDKNILFLMDLLKQNDISFEVIESKNDNENRIHDVYEFKTLLDESRYVFNEIKNLLDNGVNIRNIKICNYNDDYYHTFYRLSSFYNIPINFDGEKNILQTSIAKKLLEELLNDENKTIEDVMKKLNSSNVFYKRIMNIVNSYRMIHYNPKDLIDVFKMELKNIKYESIRYDNGITLTNLYSPNYNSDDHVFVIGFNQNILPRIFVDNSYLTDDILSQMGLNTSFELTKLDNKIILHNLNLDAKYHLSYKLSSPFASYLPSEFIQDNSYNVVKGVASSGICELEDNIIYAESLDNYYKYAFKDSYYNDCYDISYSSYDNSFKGLSSKTISHILPDVIKLSYSTIDIYAECPFRYLISKVLYLDEFEHTQNTLCGTYAHKVLELYYKHKNLNYDELKSLVIKEIIDSKENEIKRGNDEITASLEPKEAFFYSVMDYFIKDTIEFNKIHEEKAHITNVLTEYKENISLDNGRLIFTGSIDKVLIKEKNGQRMVAIIDYKTGAKEPRLDFIEYGFNMQLPSYAYMVACDKNTFNDADIIGLYLQRIGPSSKEEYALRGYSNISGDIWRELDDLDDSSASEYIMGLKTKKDGSLSKQGLKPLDDDKLEELRRIVQINVFKFYHAIREGDFSIAPKYDGNKNLSCQFCKYKNICNRTNERVDLAKDGEGNGMD